MNNRASNEAKQSEKLDIFLNMGVATSCAGIDVTSSSTR
jgi:hypothetical protein